jgi:hypothetical protein
MRIRTIKPEFFNHEGIYEAEKEFKLPLRVAFIGLWCAADREGRFRVEPRRLGIQILPYDNVDFSRVLHALSTRGFVVIYRVDDVCFGCIPGFQKHQIVNNRESFSSIPSHESENASFPNSSEELDAWVTRGSRAKDALSTPAKGKGREGKGRESVETTRARNPLVDAMVAACGGDPMQTTKTAFAQAGVALSSISEVCPNVTPEMIHAKAAAYRKAHPDWSLTTSALAKHWGNVGPIETQPDWMLDAMRSAKAPAITGDDE